MKDIDYGFAGDVDAVNAKLIQVLLTHQLTPVFCAITHDGKGQLLNTNADTIAAELAKELSDFFEVELMYCFEKSGVLVDKENEASVIEYINTEIYQTLKNTGIIADGMIPKIDNCFDALQNGVSKVIIGKPEVINGINIKYTSLVL